MMKKTLVVAVAALAGLTMLAQEKKETPKKAASAAGILHPERARRPAEDMCVELVVVGAGGGT